MKSHFKSSFNIFTLFALLASLLGSAVFATPAYAAGIVVNSNADTIADDGTCTLREAITNANGDSQLYTSAGECALGAETDTITFAANHTITLDGSQLPAVTSTIVINGNGSANTIIQASTCNPITLPGGCTPASYRVFEVSDTGNLTLGSLTVRHGQCSGSCAIGGSIGGGILNEGTLTITNSTISNNITVSNNTGSYGGGINNGGTLNIINSTLSDNSAYQKGGGIYSYGTLTITNSTLSGNFANSAGGGGIYNYYSTLTITDSIFSNNHSEYSSGGGIYSQSGTVNITNSTFSSNFATQGGGVFNGYILNVTNSTFSENSATGNGDFYRGGGIFNAPAANTNITNSTFSNNQAGYGGGNLNWGVLAITNSTLTSNSASMKGGGIQNETGTANITNSTFSINSATYGGGINNGYYDYDNGTVNVTNSTISGNSATYGGGIYNYRGALHYANSIIANSTSNFDCVNDDIITANVNNLVEDGSCLATLSGDPHLSPLADNGGPTQTMALLTGSVAIDAGDDSVCPATDQRGTTRPQGNGCDVGAFESSESGGTPTFADVPFDHPLHDYIEALYQAGYTAGCSTDPLMYCPDTILDRAQSAVFMLRGQMGSTYSPPPAPWDTFTDDWTGFEWAEPWAEGMWQEGLTAGCQPSPLMYCPATQLPRVEASVFGLRMKYGVNYTPPAGTGTLFADMTDTSYWGIGWAEQAYRDGLLPACGTDSGTGKPLFCSSELVDRAWGAYLIVKAKNIPLP